MSLGNILGQILQQGMSGQGRSRLDHAVGAGGIGDLLGGLLGGQAGGGAAGGGLGDLLGAALGGGRSGGAAGAGGLGDLLGGALGGALGGGGAAGGGGLGDLLGSVLGGGRSGGTSRPGGSNAGMAILATIAMAALKNWTDSRRAQASMVASDAGGFPSAELEAMTAPDTEALILRAMLSAAKADGRVEEDEIQRIVGKIGADGLSEDEKQFLINELRTPLDLDALVAAVPNEMVAAEVYAASLFAIDLDTEAEIAYLRRLARALGLDGATVARLHQITGATLV